MLLLDTHVMVWLAEGMPDLPQKSRDLIDLAAREVGLAVSSISFWEIAMLHSRQRISLSLPAQQWRELVLENPAITEVPLSGEVAIESVLLPGSFHSDPADRMLVATSRLHRWQLATRDREILTYAAAGHVNSIQV
jgi:PIN domain nuclease of toxin-antitoxin system